MDTFWLTRTVACTKWQPRSTLLGPTAFHVWWVHLRSKIAMWDHQGTELATLLHQLSTLTVNVTTDGFANIDGHKLQAWFNSETQLSVPAFKTGGTMAAIKLHSLAVIAHSSSSMDNSASIWVSHFKLVCPPAHTATCQQETKLERHVQGHQSSLQQMEWQTSSWVLECLKVSLPFMSMLGCKFLEKKLSRLKWKKNKNFDVRSNCDLI